MDRNYIFLIVVISVTIWFPWVNSQSYAGPLSRQVEVFVNVYDHPKTGFSCQGKNPGQYYADPATKCAVYYVCIPNPTGTMSAQSFACPNGTIFSQATRVCRPHEEVFCPLASRYYDSINGNIDTKVEPIQELSLAAITKPKVTKVLTQPKTQIPVNNVVPGQNVAVRDQINTGRGYKQRANSRSLIGTTSTTTSTPPPPPPPPPSSASHPADLGVGDYEYDYSDYNETGLINAATLLQSTIMDQENGAEAILTSNNNNNNNNNNNHNNNNNGMIIHRRKRQANIKEIPLNSESYPISPDVFNCQDKISGLAYADIGSNCQRFFVCLSISKGKLMAYSFNCDHGKRFNQQKGGCDVDVDRKSCQKSQHHYIYKKLYKSNKKHMLNIMNKS